MRRRWKVLGVAAAAVVMLAPTLVSRAQAGTAAQPAASSSTSTPSVLPAGHTYTVTLLSGDVVTLRSRASGCPLVSVKLANPGRVVTKTCTPDGHAHVVPVGAAARLGSVYDPALFDVTTLIQEGYDDASSSDLPVIVQYADDTAKARSTFHTGLSHGRGLPSIRGEAGHQPKAQATKQAAALPGLGTAPAPSAAGVRHVWLDHKVRALQDAGGTTSTTLDDDLTQIGAPTAWASGLTGKGVRVAVLDTGVDATHPDLTGKIAESANFSDAADVVDHFGHGTHVAATIAGTGVASGGRRRGVAPDAQLVIGKVLDDSGSGTDSMVIAGMQWAAPRAQVVNMSLGGFEASDGTDALSQALNALTAQYGTLFVVAAGNAGPMQATVASPGAAASALTVGAVDATDTLASFSSRGPLINTRAVKPEIVAPGVGIVEARAAGTGIGTIIDGHYTMLSGTSMATPHVAGATAILAGRHGDWHAAQLKAALVGAADPISEADIYAQGGGRLDIPKALTGLIADPPVVNLGTLAYPQTSATEHVLSWTNTRTSAVTLALSVAVTDHDGRPAPAGAVALSASTVRVAVGRSASVQLRVYAPRLAAHPGLYEGVVTADVGGQQVRTPVAFYVEPPSYDLTVRTTALPGTPDGAMSGWAYIADLNNADLFSTSLTIDASGQASVRVPAGRYSVIGGVDDNAGATREAIGGDPDVTVSGPTTVTIDGASGKPVTSTVTGVDSRTVQVELISVQTDKHGLGWGFDAYWAPGDDWPRPAVYAIATPGARVGHFYQTEAFTLTDPGDGPAAFRYDLARALPAGSTEPSYVLDAAQQARLARIDEHLDRLDAPGSITTTIRWGATPDGLFGLGGAETVDNAATRIDYVTPGISWFDEAFYNGVLKPVINGKPVDSRIVIAEGGATYQPGSRQEKTWVRQPLRPDWYDDPSPTLGGSPGSPFRTTGNLHVELLGLTDQHNRFNHVLEFNRAWGAGITRTLTLSRDGQQLGSISGSSLADFTVPQAEATYALTYDLDMHAILPVSTRVTTTWTFRSAGPSDASTIPLPLLAVDYTLPLDATNHPNGTAASFTIRQANGVATQKITGLSAWTSTDDGQTWTAAAVSRASADQFTAQLAGPAAGQNVSLKVSATADGGSAIDQTIIRAYRMP